MRSPHLNRPTHTPMHSDTRKHNMERDVGNGKHSIAAKSVYYSINHTTFRAPLRASLRQPSLILHDVYLVSLKLPCPPTNHTLFLIFSFLSFCFVVVVFSFPCVVLLCCLFRLRRRVAALSTEAEARNAIHRVTVPTCLTHSTPFSMSAPSAAVLAQQSRIRDLIASNLYDTKIVGELEENVNFQVNKRKNTHTHKKRASCAHEYGDRQRGACGCTPRVACRLDWSAARLVNCTAWSAAAAVAPLHNKRAMLITNIMCMLFTYRARACVHCLGEER